MAVFSPDSREKIQSLILNKLFLKVGGDEFIFSKKVKLVSHVFENILQIAQSKVEFHDDFEKSNHDASEADTDLYKLYRQEIEGYTYFLKYKDWFPEKKLQADIIKILNDDPILFEKNLHSLIMKSLRRKPEFHYMAINMLENYISYIKFLASSENTDLALQNILTNIGSIAEGDWLKNVVLNDATLITKLAEKEIEVYRRALQLCQGEHEFYDIFLEVKLMLEKG